MRSVEWHDGKVRMIDQHRLPWELVPVDFSNYTDVARAISEQIVRGDLAVAAAAAYGMALAAHQFDAENRLELLRYLEEAAQLMKQTRPAVIDLARAVDRVMRVARSENWQRVRDIRKEMLRMAQRIAEETVAINLRMAVYGATLIRDGDTILHFGSTGALAAVSWGTALGAVAVAHEQGKRVHVLLCESRPQLDGALLAAWELQQAGIPFEIIPDAAAGHFLQGSQVRAVLTGAGRITTAGSLHNTIGTYALAVLAAENGVPFFAVAPTTAIDTDTTGDEEPPAGADLAAEIRTLGGYEIVPADYPARSPAYDTTPPRYITGIVTENGIIYPPYDLNTRRAAAGILLQPLPEGFEDDEAEPLPETDHLDYERDVRPLPSDRGRHRDEGPRPGQYSMLDDLGL